MQPSPPPDLGNKSWASNARAQYTSNVTKTEEFIVNEKFITFPQDHQLSLANMSLEEKSILSITTLEIIVLILVGISKMLSMIRSTRKSQ